MNISMRKEELIDELINFVITSTDIDNLILSTFIAGMQAKGKPLDVEKEKIMKMETDKYKKSKSIQHKKEIKGQISMQNLM